MIGAATLVNEYDPDAISYFNRMVSAGAAPNAARRAAYDTLIKSLKSAGVWALGHHLAIQAAADQPTALLDLFGNFDMSIVGSSGSVTFTADRGITASSSKLLGTTFIPSTHITTITDFSIGVFNRGAVSPAGSSNPSVGAFDGTNYLQVWPLLDPDNQAVAILNKTAGSAKRHGSPAGSLTSPFTLAQGDFNNAEVYRNGVLLTPSGSYGGTQGKPTVPVYFGGYNNNGTAVGIGQQVMATWIGKSLTSGQQLALYNALHTFGVAVGAL